MSNGANLGFEQKLWIGSIKNVKKQLIQKYKEFYQKARELINDGKIFPPLN